MFRLSSIVVLCGLLGCVGQNPSGPSVLFDPCGPLTVAMPAELNAEQQHDIGQALELWNAKGLTRLALGESAPNIDLRFADASEIFFGVYDDQRGQVVINRTVPSGAKRSVVIAHELGHAMGLSHVEPSVRPSVMNPGNDAIGPTSDDNLELRALWNDCSARAP